MKQRCGASLTPCFNVDSEVNSAALDALVEPQSLHVSFQAVLAELLCRTGEAFPFHVLPHLRTLANLDKVRNSCCECCLASLIAAGEQVDDGREVDFAKKKAADVILHRCVASVQSSMVHGPKKVGTDWPAALRERLWQESSCCIRHT